jgi:hypothetical protein
MNILEEKEDFSLKNDDNISNELLLHLKRHFPMYEHKIDFMEKPFKWVFVDDKLVPLNGNKKYLVGKIASLVGDTWFHLGIPTIRRTIKKYIDGISK